MIKKFGTFLFGLLCVFGATVCFDWNAVWLIQSYVFGFCMGFVSLYVFWLGVTKILEVFTFKKKKEIVDEQEETKE